MSGVAGYKAQIRLGGTPTAFTNADAPVISNDGASVMVRISDALKRVLSANHSVVVKNSSNVVIENSVVNYLEGIILLPGTLVDPEYFDTEFTVDGYYIPLGYIGGSKDYSLEIGGDVLDDSAFHDDTELSGGYRTKVYGIHDIKASIGRWSDYDNNLLLPAKLAQTPVFVSIIPGASKVSIKGWFQIETNSLLGDIGSLEEESVSLVLCDNNTKRNFSYCYDYTLEELRAMTFLEVEKNYIPEFA